MQHVDFSPLFRSSVGFDRLQFLLDAAAQKQGEAAQAYPPYNISSSEENRYLITMAVPGFDMRDLEISLKEETLTISGRVNEDDEGITFLHRGIPEGTFERKFDLAGHIKVIGANLDRGMLCVDLERIIPEEMKPRKIEIKSGS